MQIYNMNTRVKSSDWERLSAKLEGDFYQAGPWKVMYATDASAYRSIPEAVVRPKNSNDISTLLQFAGETGTALIPRAAGTSLAGQVVGEGIVVDISKYFTRILELNTTERWVRVEPG